MFTGSDVVIRCQKCEVPNLNIKTHNSNLIHLEWECIVCHAFTCLSPQGKLTEFRMSIRTLTILMQRVLLDRKSCKLKYKNVEVCNMTDKQIKEMQQSYKELVHIIIHDLKKKPKKAKD